MTGGSKSLTWPSQNQTEFNHEGHEGQEVFLFFMPFMSFMVEHFLAQNARSCLSRSKDSAEKRSKNRVFAHGHTT
jgi:hypothetical protein